MFSSYSWSANVCGRKKWIFIPPGEEEYLEDSLGNLPYDVCKGDISSIKHFEVIQQPGEVIFVPSGWHHQVWNLDDTISINHNWINGCNINVMYETLNSNLQSIEKEIQDCKSMDNFLEHCQLMLNTLFGMDFYKFYDFIKYIAVSRISIINGDKQNTLFHGYEIGNNHVKFDLSCIRQVLLKFVNCDMVHNLEYFNMLEIDPSELLKKVENII